MLSRAAGAGAPSGSSRSGSDARRHRRPSVRRRVLSTYSICTMTMTVASMRHGEHEAEEAEHQRHQRLRDDGQRRRQIHPALHEQRNEDVVLEELDADVDDGDEERLLRRVEEAHRDRRHAR